jgi:hypothetical protein
MNPCVVLAVSVSLAGCFEHVASKPPPEPDLVFYAGTEPVTPGTRLVLMVAWEGWCKYSTDPQAELGGGNNDYPCQQVANTVEIRCPDDSCTWTKTGDDGYDIVPTKVGTLRPSVVVTRTSDGSKHVKTLGAVEVVVPTTATASCQITGVDGAFVRVDLTAGDRAVEDPNLALTHGAGIPCEQMGSGTLFQCPMPLAADETFTLSTPHYRLQATAKCE